ncbi:TPA: hypothetical protein ACH3X1_006707 [Trebouxia sp. C0004]
MWWDERFASFDGAVVESDSQEKSPFSKQLTASIALESAYVRTLVQEAFDRRPEWTVNRTELTAEEAVECAGNDESLFYWGEYEGIDWEKVHSGEQHACCYCFRKGLIRKAHLCHNTKKWAAKHPKGWLAKSVPESFIFELDDIEYIEEALCDVPEVRDMPDGSARWIAKPSITNQATGICIFERVSQLETALYANEDLREWVLQRYIERPLLIQQCKFHLRVYVLCVGSLKAYVYDQVLALFAGQPYDSELRDLGNLDAHLTNTCRLEGGVDEEQSVRLLSELPQLLAKEGMTVEEAEQRIQQVSKDMQAIIGECIDAVSGELTFFTLPNCFELFGFDLMVDDQWHVWLLEANAEPDLQQTGSRLKPMVAGVIEGIMQLVVDPLAMTQGVNASQPASLSEDFAGRWVEVLDKQQGRHLGSSGMAFQ